MSQSWQRSQSEAAYYHSVVILRVPNGAVFNHFIQVDQTTFDRCSDLKRVVRPKSSVSDISTYSLFITVKSKKPDGKQNPLYTTINRLRSNWRLVENNSILFLSVREYGHCLEGVPYWVPETSPNYFPTEAESESHSSTPDHSSTSDTSLVNELFAPLEGSPSAYFSSLPPTPTEEVLAPSAPTEAPAKRPTDAQHPMNGSNLPTLARPGFPAMTGQSAAAMAGPLLAALAGPSGYAPFTGLPAMSAPPPPAPNNTAQGGLLPLPAFLQQTNTGPTATSLEEMFASIRHGGPQDLNTMLDPTIQKLGNAAAKMRNLNAAITREVDRLANGVPSLLAQAALVKMPYGADFSEDYFKECNEAFLNISLWHTKRSIEELIRIRNEEWAVWDQLMASLAPRKLTQQEWEQMNVIMESKLRNYAPMATNCTDPKTLKFLLPPDTEKRHTFVGPNQALRSMYTTSGQRPPGKENAQNTTARSENRDNPQQQTTSFQANRSRPTLRNYNNQRRPQRQRNRRSPVSDGYESEGGGRGTSTNQREARYYQNKRHHTDRPERNK